MLLCDAAFTDASFDDLPCDTSSGELMPPVIVRWRFYDPAMYVEVIYRHRVIQLESCPVLAVRD